MLVLHTFGFPNPPTVVEVGGMKIHGCMFCPNPECGKGMIATDIGLMERVCVDGRRPMDDRITCATCGEPLVYDQEDR